MKLSLHCTVVFFLLFIIVDYKKSLYSMDDKKLKKLDTNTLNSDDEKITTAFEKYSDIEFLYKNVMTAINKNIIDDNVLSTIFQNMNEQYSLNDYNLIIDSLFNKVKSYWDVYTSFFRTNLNYTQNVAITNKFIELVEKPFNDFQSYAFSIKNKEYMNEVTLKECMDKIKTDGSNVMFYMTYMLLVDKKKKILKDNPKTILGFLSYYENNIMKKQWS